jgi:hypothetical protein
MWELLIPGVFGKRAAGPPAVIAWTDLGVNATIAAEGTADARTIWTIEPFSGKLYLGHGNYTVDSGPCDIIAWDPATEAYETALASVEVDAITIMRVIDNVLYVIGQDTTGIGNTDYATFDGTTWTEVDRASLAQDHLFDVQEFGSSLYIGGQIDGTALATVWRSTDGGTTWTAVETTGTDQRTYLLMVHGGWLYAQTMHTTGGPRSLSRRTQDGTTWSDGPDLLAQNLGSGWKSYSLANGDACFLTKGNYNTSIVPIANATNYPVRFDGAASEVQAFGPAWDWTKAGDWIYCLFQDQTIRATQDLVSWFLIADDAPAAGRSIGVLDSLVYIGTTDSKLWRGEITVPETPDNTLLFEGQPLTFEGSPLLYEEG